MTLGQLLRKQNNNLDLFRLLAAVGVIVGHAYSISPQPPLQDGVASLLGFDYSGSLAVKFFFFLSGVLVTNSIVGNPNVVSFLMARSLRLFPGLIVCVVLSALLLGTLVTDIDKGDYLRRPDTWAYIRRNFLLSLQWELPGVFKTNPSSVVNGSLWTLPIECFCYLALAVLGGAKLLSNRLLASAALLGAMAALCLNRDILPAVGLPAEAWQMPLIFALGALLAVHKDVIEVNLQLIISLLIASFLVRRSWLLPYVLPMLLFLSAMYLSTWESVRRIVLPGDFSYGVYLYGFPAQQLGKYLWPAQGVHANQAAGIGLALLCGAASWYLVERPALRKGQQWRQLPLIVGMKRVTA